MAKKYEIKNLVIVILVVLIGYALITGLLSPESKKRLPCEGKEDGTFCGHGVWYDKDGKVCGGKSCVGYGLGKCLNRKCVRTDTYYETIFEDVDDPIDKIDKCLHDETIGTCLTIVINYYKDDVNKLRSLCEVIQQKTGESAQEYEKSFQDEWKLENCVKRYNY